jgi:hypothetical protein
VNFVARLLDGEKMIAALLPIAQFSQIAGSAMKSAGKKPKKGLGEKMLNA